MNDSAPAVDEDGAKTQMLCFVLDDEPAVGRFIAVALRAFDVRVEQFIDVESMLSRLTEARPEIIFLDVALGDEDAVEALRLLATRKFRGGIVLMSGWAAALLNDVRRIGERRGLHMLPPLEKPFRLEAIRRTLDALGDERPDPPTIEVAAPVVLLPRVDLGKALDAGWVELWYQPKLHLQERRLVGAEGLARIRHPDYGVLKPESFVGASEGDLIRLAEIAVRRAVHDSAEFARMGRHLRLAVNVPVAALLSLPIAEIVREERGRHGSWNGLLLEVTEEQIIHDIPLAHEIATRLRIHGIALTLDDFGTGYSSLERLADLPFVEMKLARTLVAGCSTDKVRADLCHVAIDLGHRLNCAVVAEGIETTADLAAIRQLNCDIGQGYLFAHAMPKEFLATRLIAQAPDGGFATIMDLAEDTRRAIA